MKLTHYQANIIRIVMYITLLAFLFTVWVYTESTNPRFLQAVRLFVVAWIGFASAIPISYIIIYTTEYLHARIRGTDSGSNQ